MTVTPSTNGMAKQRTILVVDDDTAIVTVLGLLLKQAGYAVETAEDGTEALSLVARRSIDAVITDLRMPGMDGMRLLDALQERAPDLPVVMLTAHGGVADAVDAMKRGAAEFMLKPFERDEIIFVLDKVLRSQPDAPPAFAPDDEFVGEAEAMQEVFDLVRRAGQSTATVLVRGETGTGKELIARAIHNSGARAHGPLVKVHCAALPETLLESELFGYEKGAFTGAVTRKPGRIELAEGGTLFLDEIGDISPATQVKLLRVLQDREFERVGGTATLSANVRFIAATHRDLETMVDEGEFREDLFYRLNVIPIWSPPLRDRREDIARLARHFAETFGAANDRQIELTKEAIERLRLEPWPGNVRELQNLIERLVVLSDAEQLGVADVERELARVSKRPRKAGKADETDTLEEHRRRAEADAIVEALDKCRGNRSQAARLLGVSRRTLYNKLEEYDVE